MTNPVLYDQPGPRSRWAARIVGAVALVAVAVAVYLLVYRPLEANGQFTMRKWGPLIDPDNRNFVRLWRRLGQGLWATFRAAVGAIIASLIGGTLLAVLRVQFQHLRRRRFGGNVALQALAKGYNGLLRANVEVLRGLPVIITIFFVARILPEFGIQFPTLWYIVIGLTLYNGVVIAEILRSGMTGLPGGQREAAEALGLSSFKTIRLILLPQSYRIMLPALISQIVVIFKDTSLGFLIGYEDLLQVSNQAILTLRNPIQLYFVVGVIFIVINYGLSKLATYVQRRLERSRGGAPAGPAPSTVSVGLGAATD
jgi:glutamate transport system permease protein